MNAIRTKCTIYRHSNGCYRARLENGWDVGPTSCPFEQLGATLLQDQLVYFNYIVEFEPALLREWGVPVH